MPTLDPDESPVWRIYAAVCDRRGTHSDHDTGGRSMAQPPDTGTPSVGGRQAKSHGASATNGRWQTGLQWDLDDLTFRQIFMDGRTLEANPFPSWMGYSVGRWEGETLVVDSFGFNDKTWLNGRGLQHTEALRMTERYTRPDVGHLRIDVSYADPGAYLK